MRVTDLELIDFRCHREAHFELPEGVTVVVGRNGTGKTSLLEAVAWPAIGHSLRGVPDAALVRAGVDRSVLRMTVAAGEREQLIEVELARVGRNRVQVNRNPVTRMRDLLGALRVTVFAPDDLDLVKGGPALRRAYLDELLSSLAPRYHGVRGDYERVLRQRNALLKSGLRGDDAASTLDVFDDQLARTGAELVRGRLRLLDRLGPLVDEAYRSLAGGGGAVEVRYESEWVPGKGELDELVEALHRALGERRRHEVDRGVTLVGPHRDDLGLEIGEFPARTQASQGEQRTLALALRLGSHRVAIETTGDEPVLLLDDVFSELDPGRADALVRELTAEQTLVTTAGQVPDRVEAAQRLVLGEVGP